MTARKRLAAAESDLDETRYLKDPHGTLRRAARKQARKARRALDREAVEEQREEVKP